MRALLLGLALATSMTSSPAQGEPEAPHNIVLLLADDLGTEMLASYGIGIDTARTPNLDALAANSVLFRNAWSSPVCSPTRACIQTGRFGFRTGIGLTVKDRVAFNGLSASELILPELLDLGTESLYRHALFGKWHLNHASKADLSGAPIGPDVVRVQGYGHHEGMIHNILAPDSYFDWPKVSNGVVSRSTTYATTATVDDFLAWQSTVTEPFFAVVAFNAPHTPLHAPPAALHTEDLTLAGPPKANPRLFYKAMVEALDTELGRLLAQLRQTSPNTTIIFMGDNGTPEQIIGEDPFQVLPSGHSKGSTYEGGVNVPLFISGPRVIAPGTDCFAPVHAVDIFATVAELAGIELEEVYPSDRTLDSKSLVPFLSNPGHAGLRRYNFTEKFFENTPEEAQVDHQQLHRTTFCQEEVPESGTSGAPGLSICGRALVAGTDNEATILLRGAPANAMAYFLAGKLNPMPNPNFGGAVTLSSKLFKEVFTMTGSVDPLVPFTTSSQGQLEIPGIIHQKSNPADYYVQFAVLDPSSNAWLISNGVRVNQTTNLKAVVNSEGYKLVANVGAGLAELYYLPADPRETVDLLAGGLAKLTANEFEAYGELRAAMADLLRSEPQLGGR